MNDLGAKSGSTPRCNPGTDGVSLAGRSTCNPCIATGRQVESPHGGKKPTQETYTAAVFGENRDLHLDR